LCLVDDAQWLDRASARALAFVARRLLAESIAVLFATREVGDLYAGLATIRVEPLGYGDATALLNSELAAPLDESVVDRIIAEARGNPLALLELPRGLTPAQLAGGFGLPATSVPAGVEQSFERRLEASVPLVKAAVGAACNLTPFRAAKRGQISSGLDSGSKRL
jgi:hypothetical protein